MFGFSLAIIFDAWVGELPLRLHPVVYMGGLTSRLKPWALRGTPMLQFLKGAALTLLLTTGSAAAAWLSLRVCAGSLLLQTLSCAFWITSAFALRALTEAVLTMQLALSRGDLRASRLALRSLCSRDAAQLNESQLAAGTLESVSENASDSVIAPLFFFCVFGVPGMVAYRAANTLDAMLGYRGELEYTGKFAARLDDALNWVPARVTAVLLLLAAPVAGGRAGAGFEVMRQHASLTDSPNAGYPMAAFAGLLGVALEKPGCYVLGGNYDAPTAETLTAGLNITRAACWLGFALVLGLLLYRAL